MRKREMRRLMNSTAKLTPVQASAVADDAGLYTDGTGLLASAARALDIEHQPTANANRTKSTRDSPMRSARQPH